jgi:hypothetical protein
VLAAGTRNTNWAVLSLLPWSAALLLWQARPRPFTMRFTEDALEVGDGPLVVRYADLEGLRAPGRPANPFKAGRRHYRIQVLHAGGVLHVPARLNVPSDDVFIFLFRQFSPCGSRDVPDGLASYLRLKERTFGPQRVWTYCARARRARGGPPRQVTAFFLALALCGAGWLLWGVLRPSPWAVGGGALLLVGGFLSLVLWLAGRPPRDGPARRDRPRSGLVIAPDGLALLQGDLSGELGWEELRDVKLMQRAGPNSTAPAVVLHVQGALIPIADVYDRPIGLIYQQICHYWRGQSAGDGREWGEAARRLPEAISRPAEDGASSQPSERIMPPE